VRISTTGGLTQPHFTSELGDGLCALNNWVQTHPLEDFETETERLCKDVRLRHEERELNRPGFTGE